MSKTEFAMAMPKWVAEIKDEAVRNSVFALIFSHKISGDDFTEKSLEDEISEFGDLNDDQKKAVFDAIVAHKDEK